MQTNANQAAHSRTAETSALFGVDETYKEDQNNSSWYVATEDNLAFSRYVHLAAGQLVRRMCGLKDNASSLNQTDGYLLTSYQKLLAAKEHIRVKKTRSGFSAFLPIYYGDINIKEMWTEAFGGEFRTDGWYVQTRDTLIAKIGAAINGADFLDPSQVIDVTLPSNSLGQDVDAELIGADEPDTLDKIRQGIKSYRLVSPAAASRFNSAISDYQRNAWADGSITDYEARRYVSEAFKARTFVLFVEFETPMNAARFICQGEPTLSLIAEYFIRVSEWLWNPSNKEFVHNIVPISRISELNKQSTIPVVPRVNDHNLSVNAKGTLLWIPTADNAEFVEQEMEEGGLQPNGEWTRLDCIDPEANEFTTTVDANGHTRRVKKPKGRNRLLLTDWHNSRLSYTREDGNMDVMDLSMFRPAKAGQIHAMLTTKLIRASEAGSAILSSLGFAFERGRELGIKLDMNPEWFRDWCTDRRAEELLERLNRGEVALYIENVTNILNYARVDATATTQTGPRQLSADELNALDDLLDRKWFTMDLISLDSPIHMLRPLAEFLHKTHERAMIDPSAVFGRYVVRNTLAEMAALIVAVNYAGKSQELAQIDSEERKQYLEPDLSPIDQIEVTDIPLVSGTVELFPHQVKAWNWLKNSPPNAVIDVAAGGGKTLLALLDIAYHIGKGMRWPLIICPDDLVKNYINDAAWLFAGKMNMIVINNVTLNSKEWGEEKLINLIEGAPINSIFLTDYTFIVPNGRSKRVQSVVYGTVPMTVSLNNEMLKRINWGGIWMDESHQIKNPHSIRNREIARLAAVAPFKRQLSGTYISDNLTDVVGQMNLMDPQVFGDVERFEEEFFPDGRRSAPIPGAQKEIYKRMSEHANVVTIRRKEWAALLPRRQDTFHPVQLTPNQFKVYLEILDIQKEELSKKLQTDPELRSMLDGAGRTAEDENETEDEEQEVSDDVLGFYLARLEQFLTAPDADEYARSKLSGDDLKSPKLLEVENLVRQHIADKVPGKILVWTVYIESAAHIYENLSPDLKDKFVYYTASTADQAMAAFETDPTKIGMIGCEKSMNTGHNLQFCSRIIRLETVWNWGTLEQGESRINRPRRNDPRRHENGGQGIFYDWIFCNKSIDVTKNSRMISKLISTIKFYERDNPHYQSLDEPPPIRLSQKNIFNVNDWMAKPDLRGTDQDNSCERYFMVYQQYQQLEQQEFDNFVNDPANRLEPYALEEGAILEGSALLKKVPYIPQMKIYNSSQLGLIPFMEYIGTEYSDKKRKTLITDDPNWSPEGLKIHCEFGDCVAKAYNKARSGGKPTTMRVMVPDGSTESIPLTMAWVITKDTTSGREMREAIAKAAGASTKLVVPDKIAAPSPTKTAQDTRAPEADSNPGFQVYVERFDNYMSLVVNSDDEGVIAAQSDLKAWGFLDVPPYWYAKVSNFKALRKWIDSVQTKVKIHPAYLKRLEADYELWAKHQKLEKFAFGLAQQERKNFLREQHRPADKGVIKPYLVIQEDTVFLCLNMAVNKASFSRVKAVSVPGVAWRANPVANEQWAWFRTKAECQMVLKQMFAKYTIENRKEIIKEFAAIKLIGVGTNK